MPPPRRIENIATSLRRRRADTKNCPAWAGSMQGGKGPSSLMTAPSAASITHLRVVCTRKLEIKSCKVVGARSSVAPLWSCGKRATSKRCTQAHAPHRELYDDARPQHAMLWPQSIISSSLFSCSGACIKDDVFQLWLNFNSYASPKHPLYVQDYCDVTGPGYGVTVIMVTVKKGHSNRNTQYS